MINFVESLDVYNISRQLIVSVYNITKRFSKDEIYGLSLQMRRAAVSILSNLSEGGSRITDAEKRNFFGYARGSAAEIKAQLVIANDLGFINPIEYDNTIAVAERVHKMITGLIKSTEKKQ